MSHPSVSIGEAVLLVLAGVGGGLAGSIAGLASLVTYPALLATGLAPVAANVTNTVSLLGSTVGIVSASRPELQGQRDRLSRLVPAGMAGGVAGGVLLLATPAGSFELVVPWLIALGSLSMLLRSRLLQFGRRSSGDQRWLPFGTAAIGVYGGYFGAGAGVLLLGLLLVGTQEQLPRANAAKNLVLGLANCVAAVAFMVFGPVHWPVVVPLGAGLFIGGRMGPAIVRRLPADRLRVAVALAGLGLAVKLGINAYR